LRPSFRPQVVFRLRLRTAAAALGAIVLGLASHKWLKGNVVPFGWWDFRPFLTLLYLPLIIWAHGDQARLRRLVSPICFGCTLLFLMWMELKRPTPPILMGEWCPNPIGLVQLWLMARDFPKGFDGSWLIDYGTAFDALSLFYPLLVFPILGRCRTPHQLIAAWAVPVWIMRATDWITSGRMRLGWSIMEFLVVDETPIHLAGDWIAGRKSLPVVLESLGAVRLAELLVLCLTLAYLVVLCVPRSQPFERQGDQPHRRSVGRQPGRT
jgi:hypothetical protein